MNQYIIYCLIDPRNGNPFYIGVTKMKLRQRLAAHCANPSFLRGAIMNRKIELIKEIKQSGFYPEIVPLKKCSFGSVDKYEKLLYYHFRGLGFNLLQDERAFSYYAQQLRNQSNLK